MKRLYSVDIYEERFPVPSEVPDGEEVFLICVSNGDDTVELVIEPYELDAYDEDYSHSTYVIYISKNGETVGRLNSFLPDFEEMETREIINVMVDYFMNECGVIADCVLN